MADQSLSLRIEHALERALTRATDERMPSTLAAALRYAVFPGGARVRPHLCLLAATTNGDRRPRLADRAAAAVELLHCASLVHDDLPCFDNATERRGKPALHRTFGQSLAILVGDQLIVQAFTEIGGSPRLIALLAASARDLVTGQSREGQPGDLQAYHDEKTASLFATSAAMGAIAGGGDPEAWHGFGLAIGRAYQAADDLFDTAGSAAEGGKPVGRDAALGRPNIVAEMGVEATRERIRKLLRHAEERAPAEAARVFVATLQRQEM